LDKAEKILAESESFLESTLVGKNELDKKITFFLGYCFLWVSGLFSIIVFHYFEIGWLLIPVVLYLFGLIYISFKLIKALSPMGYRLAGNRVEKIAHTQSSIDQKYEFFLIGIALEISNGSHHNQKQNKNKADALSGGLKKIVWLSVLCSLLLLAILFAEFMNR